MTSTGDFQIPRKPLPARDAYVAVPANASEHGCGDHSQIAFDSGQMQSPEQRYQHHEGSHNPIELVPWQNSTKGGVRNGVYDKLTTDEPKLSTPKASRQTTYLGSRWL